MKKTMVRFASLVLCLLCLCGCGSGEEEAVLGTWTGTIHMTDLFTSQFLGQLEPEMREHIHFSDFSVTMILTFHEDETYTSSVDQEKLYATMDGIKQEMRSGIESYFQAVIADTGAATTVEEALAASGTSLDVLIEEVMSPDLIRSMVEELCAEGQTQGTFSAEDGRLYMSDSSAAEEERMYDDYILEGDTLTLVTPEESLSGILAEFYPMTFHRVK